MRKLILVSLIFLSVLYGSTVYGTHIVGGEFQMQWSGRGYLYYFNMNMYYDDINADDGLFEDDPTIDVSIFSKTTNQRIVTFTLRRGTRDFINYTTNGCDNPSILRTRLFKYSGSVDLTGFNEPGGYYISWERCCRNYQTENIIHNGLFGYHISGKVFYLEFPPVNVGATRFINSSPVFTVAPAQYLCKDYLVSIDFSATDPDGDSLVYSMTDPIQGFTTDNQWTYPGPDPEVPGNGPYPLVTWVSGYSANNAIHGNPALQVNPSTGVLSVKPSENGLFVFAVLCEEYRNGVKIGEVVRDFQYLIRDCPISYPPSVGLNAGNNSDTDPDNANWGTSTDTLIVKLNRDTCYTIFVTDSNSIHGQSDFVNIYYGKTTLPRTALSFSPTRVTVSPAQDTTTMNMCFSTCDKVLIERDSVYYLDIIVVDGDENSCPKRTDTLRTYIYVDVEEANQLPTIGTTLEPTNQLNVYPDSLIQFVVYGLDDDDFDLKEIEIQGFKFPLGLYSMNFNKIFEDSDSIAYLFSWIPDCDQLNKRTEYRIDFTLKDKSCIYTHNTSTRVTLNLQDVDTGLQDLLPANLVTPNGDSLNDCFTLPNLPADNCTYVFQSVEIINRWGASIYKSSDRNFKWCPDAASDGIYYYGIDLKAKYIKGWIQVIR